MYSLRCRICKERFSFEGLPPKCCPKCQAERDEQLQMLRAVVKEFPGVTSFELHEFTHIPVEVILRFINNGELDILPDVHCAELQERIDALILQIKKTKSLLRNPDDVPNPKQ